MVNIISHSCPRCNSYSLYKYGKDKFGNQKYQCRKCKHQFAPDFVSSGSRGAKPLPPEQRKYPSCPVCGKSAFFITITTIILIIVARIKNAIIRSFKLNLLYHTSTSYTISLISWHCFYSPNDGNSFRCFLIIS